MRFDDTFADGETQACPVGSASPERVEDSIEVSRRDRGSLVLHPGFELAIPLRGADFDHPVWRGPFDGVFQQVGDQAPCLQLVDLDRCQVR